jgi:predicted ATPase/tetratricopeptide (TPR) repeat protein
MSRVSITLLGGFSAAVGGEPVPDRAWRLKKARELVKLLALARGRRLHREQLMDALWRELAPTAAANNLNQAVHVARRVLGPDAIALRDEVLSLDADVDVEAFEQAAAEARRLGTGAAIRAALALYGGELLPENRYDEWAESRREALEELRGELEAERTSAGESDGARGLPVELSSFVGREHELDELRALLARNRLLTLSGAGGVGKTRLALELVRTAAASFPSGPVFVELAPVADARLVADTIAEALDVRALPGLPTTDALVEYLASRTLLLLVDNCEHVLTAAAEVCGLLLRASPGLTIVATSREPLRVPGEVVFRVPSLAIPGPGEDPAPSHLLHYESVRLFVERAQSAAPGFELDETNAADVARVCFRLDGLPLALELAAGRAGALTPAALAERLADRFQLLRSASTASPTRQQTLAATLQWSHDLLEPDERVLFRRLSVFAGTFDLSAVEAVCSDAAVPTAVAADALARLVEKSLVTVDDSRRRRRYRLLETVRDYAHDRLAEAGETPAFALRQARWAAELAAREAGSRALDADGDNLRIALDTLLAGEPDEALRLCVSLWLYWLRRIDLAEATRRFDAALAAAPARNRLRADALLAAAAIAFRGGEVTRGIPLGEEALSVAVEIGDAELELRAVEFQGIFAFGHDAAAVVEGWIERGLELARRIHSAADEAWCIYTLGATRWLRGDLPGADDLLARSAQLFDVHADSGDTVPSPLNIADMRTTAPGERPGLRIVFEDTLQPFLEMSCAAAAAYALENQAAVARLRGDFGRARALLEDADGRFAALGDHRGRADVHARRGYLELAEGELPSAREELERSLELRRQSGDVRGIGLTLTGLGLVETMAGNAADAECHLQEAERMFRRAGDRWGLTSVLWRRADLELERGGLDEAAAALAEALAVANATGRGRWIAHTLVARAEVELRRGNEAQAAEDLAAARGHYEQSNDELGVEAVDRRLAPLLSRR